MIAIQIMNEQINIAGYCEVTQWIYENVQFMKMDSSYGTDENTQNKWMEHIPRTRERDFVLNRHSISSQDVGKYEKENKK